MHKKKEAAISLLTDALGGQSDPLNQLLARRLVELKEEPPGEQAKTWARVFTKLANELSLMVKRVA